MGMKWLKHQFSMDIIWGFIKLYESINHQPSDIHSIAPFVQLYPYAHFTKRYFKPLTCHHDYIPLTPCSGWERLPEVRDATIQATDHGCRNARLVADESLGIPWKEEKQKLRSITTVAGFLGLQRQGSMSRAKSWSILEFDEVWQEKGRTKISCMNYIHKMQTRHAAVTYRVCLQQVCRKEGWWSWSSVKCPSWLSESTARLRGICAPFRLLLISHSLKVGPCLKSSVHMYKRNKTCLPQSERIHDTNNSFQHWFSPLTPRNPTPHQPTPEPSILCKTICKVPRKSRCQTPTPILPCNRNAKLRSCMCPSS